MFVIRVATPKITFKIQQAMTLIELYTCQKFQSMKFNFPRDCYLLTKMQERKRSSLWGLSE